MKEKLNSSGIQIKHTQRFNKERQTRNKAKKQVKHSNELPKEWHQNGLKTTKNKLEICTEFEFSATASPKT